MKLRLKIIFIFFCLTPLLSFGATLTEVDVEKHGERYTLHIKAEINARADNVKNIITDYEHLISINPYLKESIILSRPGAKRTTVNMLTHACVLFVCYTMRHVQAFQPIKNNVVYGRIIPNKSDFKQGWTRWTINSNRENTVTQLIINTEMTPDFFVLPIIGTYHLKNMIAEIATVTINNLEQKAQE